MNEIPQHPIAPLSLWRNRDFKLLFGAQIVSLLGSGVTIVGLALFTYQLRRGVGDRSHRQRSDAAHPRLHSILATGGRDCGPPQPQKDSDRRRPRALRPAHALSVHHRRLVDLRADFAINAVTAFFTPTFEARIPQVVGNEQYVQALSYSRVAADVEAIARPAVAGLLVALLVAAALVPREVRCHRSRVVASALALGFRSDGGRGGDSGDDGLRARARGAPRGGRAPRGAIVDARQF